MKTPKPSKRFLIISKGKVLQEFESKSECVVYVRAAKLPKAIITKVCTGWPFDPVPLVEKRKWLVIDGGKVLWEARTFEGAQSFVIACKRPGATIAKSKRFTPPAVEGGAA